MYSIYKNHPTSLLLLVTAFLHEIIAVSAWIEKNVIQIMLENSLNERLEIRIYPLVGE